MLVLSRRQKERIRLGDSIVVTVVRVSGDTVRLGIEAPSDMLVLRDELDTRPEGCGVELPLGACELQLDRCETPAADEDAAA